MFVVSWAYKNDPRILERRFFDMGKAIEHFNLIRRIQRVNIELFYTEN